MKYRINQENYHQFDVMELGKLPPRSYFIPYESREQADRMCLKEARYQSVKVQCLNGEWDFKFYKKPEEMPEELDTDAIAFDTIPVPSCWQFQGYDKPFYVNTRYQFPYNPPRIPTVNPVEKTFCWVGADYGVKPRYQQPREEYNFVGVYRRKLMLESKVAECRTPENQTPEIGISETSGALDGTYILSFLGVASCLDLYVNGRFVGYSEGSHNTAEFDITEFLQAGENELLAVVHRWCTGTYLECQDMFRNNGIFRDVLLYHMNETDVWDIHFKTRRSPRDGQGSFADPAREYDAAESVREYDAAVKVWLNRESAVKITLSGHGMLQTKCVQARDCVAKAVFRNLPVQEWNAENPVLYDLYIELEGTCIRKRVGFKQVEIQGDLFLLNDRKVKLKGVNHHDTSCTNGYTLTPEEIERDVKLCKAYNINTIRTSHYPPDPLFLEFCDELGIYVVDEADLETHGTFSQQMPPNYNSLSHNPQWAPRYVDRAKRLYERDKMHPSIIMWSLGNEAGGYHNTDQMYRYLKKKSKLPVHYESAVHCARKAYDVGSEMYPTLKKVHETGEHARNVRQLNDRPYFMCEYAHAMGVGPGAMEEYWREIYAYDNLMGGCVWEMVDHAVLHEDGSYTYGGDHGEWEHDGNFCVDGIFYPDRSPSTGAAIVKHVYRPLRVRHVEGDQYEIFNTTSFTELKDYKILFAFSDGRKLEVHGEAAPLTKVILNIPGAEPMGAERMTVIVTEKGSGRPVSQEQIIYQVFLPEKVEPQPQLSDHLMVSKKGVFFRKGEKLLRVSAPNTLLFRAPTDNDKDFFMRSCMDDFLEQKEEVISMKRQQDQVTVVTRITCKKQEFLCTDTYQSCDRGILVTSSLHCVKGKGNLPRFGKVFRFSEAFDLVEYEGRNGESYCDMKEHALIEQVSCRVKDMTEPNIRPQESGNRCDCRYVKISDGENTFTFTAVNQLFELGVKPYSDKELLKMEHRKNEKRTGTYVTLSAFQMGIGTGSCGPATLKKYCYSMNEDYVLQYIIS